METILTGNSHHKSLKPTKKSSYMMPQSGQRLGVVKTFYSPTDTNSNTFIPPSSCQMVLNPIWDRAPISQEQIEYNLRSAEDSTLKMDVPTRCLTAIIGMSVPDARAITTMRRTAKREKERLLRSLYPKYLRYDIWRYNQFSMVAANWTLNATPLPSILISELNNKITTQTINDNPSLFQIITPINIDKFELLLKTHPNQWFVKSVCKGLREGFWPWADTLLDGYPTTHDESQPSKDEMQSDFLHSQIQVEQDEDCFSHSFGSDLLPGMYSMSIHAIPKPRSTDLISKLWFLIIAAHSMGPSNHSISDVQGPAPSRQAPAAEP